MADGMSRGSSGMVPRSCMLTAASARSAFPSASAAPPKSQSLRSLDSVRGQLHSKGLRRRREVQAVVGLIAVPDAVEPPYPVFVAAFLNAHELALLAGRGRREVHAGVQRGNQEFIGTELADQRAADRLRITGGLFAESELRHAVGNHSAPRCEVAVLGM